MQLEIARRWRRTTIRGSAEHATASSAAEAVRCVLQVWNLTNCKLRADLRGHTGYINTVTVSPDGSLCASGGKVPSRWKCQKCLLSSDLVLRPNVLWSTLIASSATRRCCIQACYESMIGIPASRFALL